MKAFLEEYGLVIVSIIIVALLISVAVNLGQKGQGKIEGSFDTFTEKADQIVATNIATPDPTPAGP